MQDIKYIIGDWKIFLDKIFEGLKEIKIEVDKFELDHIAYRAITAESFANQCKLLERVGKRLHRNTIRNRFIDIYELDVPFVYNGRIIRYIELLAPAEGDQFAEGLEHAEFIINGCGLDEFMVKYPKLEWNTNALTREIGPDIGIKLVNGYGVKFKTMSFPEIVRLESLVG